MQRKKILPRIMNLSRGVAQFDAIELAAALGPSLSASVLDQNPSHRLGGRGEEMSPAAPVLRLFDISEPQVSLMNQHRRLQRLSGFFVCDSMRRQFAKLLIDQWKELVGSTSVAVACIDENARELVHRLNDTHQRSGDTRLP